MSPIDFLWIGLGAAAGVLAVVIGGRDLSRGAGKAAKISALGWCVLIFGAVSLMLALLVTSGASWTWVMGAGIAVLIAGIGALVKGDRHWPTWTGLAIGVVPALFWALFALGSLLE